MGITTDALTNAVTAGAYLEYAAGLYGSYDGCRVDHHDSTSPSVQWTVVDLHNGRYALQAANGKYLGYCDGCVRPFGEFYATVYMPQQATVGFTDPMAQPGTQFSVTCALASPNACQSPTFAPTPSPPLPSWVIQAKSNSHFTVVLTPPQGGYLGWCSTCLPQNPISYFYADFHRTDATRAETQWIVTPFSNGKIGLRSMGKTTDALTNAVTEGAYLEYAAGLYGSYDGCRVDHHDSTSSGVQWTVVDLHNGRYALQAANGKYLGYCDGCVKPFGEFYATVYMPQQATVSFTDPMAQPGTQFSVTCAPVPGNDCHMVA